MKLYRLNESIKTQSIKKLIEIKVIEASKGKKNNIIKIYRPSLQPNFN